jgi:hypothetical protein
MQSHFSKQSKTIFYLKNITTAQKKDPGFKMFFFFALLKIAKRAKKKLIRVQKILSAFNIIDHVHYILRRKRVKEQKTSGFCYTKNTNFFSSLLF